MHRRTWSGVREASGTKERLALANVESASTIEEAELMKGALNLAIENFRESQEYKDEILKGRFTFYCVGYKDDRDAIRKLYPDLQLSSIIPPSLGQEVIEETTISNEGDAPATSESAPTIQAISEQAEEEANWWPI